MMVSRLLFLFFLAVWLIAFHVINVLGGVIVLFFPYSIEPHTSVSTCDHAVPFIFFICFWKNRISSQISTFHCRKRLQWVSQQCSSWFGHLPRAHCRSAVWWGRFSTWWVEQKTNIVFLLIIPSHSAGLFGANLSFLRLLQSWPYQLSEHHLQSGAGVSPGYCSLSVPQSHLDREKVAGMAKSWEWYRFPNQRLIRVILQGRPRDSNVTWFRMQIAFRAFATRSLPAGISASPTRTPQGWREAVCCMSSG